MTCTAMPAAQRRRWARAPLAVALALALGACSQHDTRPPIALASSELGRPLATVRQGDTSLDRQAQAQPQRQIGRAHV